MINQSPYVGADAAARSSDSRRAESAGSAASTTSTESDNPLLATLSFASERIDDLHRRATDWVASARKRAADGDTTSSTLEQIEIKQFLSGYENMLTLSNAMLAKLRELMSRITNSL
ncbi:hypothetical protein [Pandoraea pulmonicola]|uniref:Uncharacterized protein n=1 Tax=Pandoraea pulmonicola TaxID=93221 RepID=A0AAJ4ZDC9_PANPU|nr:hypothetical protein [Pandoraea pulmonicola]AJC20330.1 hypothetical protein RO07_07345 [Pandoraea pulmonicola]SUA91305.1 Uncharacterised protein [Pandoraea pulmonicola]